MKCCFDRSILCERDFGNSYHTKINLIENTHAGHIIIKDEKLKKMVIEEQLGVNLKSAIKRNDRIVDGRLSFKEAYRWILDMVMIKDI